MVNKSVFMINGWLLLLLLASTSVSALSMQWTALPATSTKQGNPGSILNNPVFEFKNAGKGGLDWIATGKGPRGGSGKQELWLFDNSKAGIPGTSEAATTFSVTSNSVAFIMNGDHNDGYAQFFVDDVSVGIFDLYHRGRSILAVTGLDLIIHSLKIVQLGYHNPASTKADVAIFGGAAFNEKGNVTEITEPPVATLFLMGFLYFWGRWAYPGISRSRMIKNKNQTSSWT